MKIEITDSGRANLLAYFLRDLLKTRISTKVAHDIASQLSSSIEFVAGKMTCVVEFTSEAIRISTEETAPATARVAGDLSTLLDVALGGNYLPHLISRKIRISGSIIVLIKIVKLFRT
jgi:hypothetical protein